MKQTKHRGSVCRFFFVNTCGVFTEASSLSLRLDAILWKTAHQDERQVSGLRQRRSEVKEGQTIQNLLLGEKLNTASLKKERLALSAPTEALENYSTYKQ